MELLQEAELWVGVGLLLFFAILVYFKVPGVATRALDERSGKIRSALDEAQRLRDEARAMLEQLKAKREDTERLAAQMLADAREEARRLEAEAKVKLEEQIVRRSALADRRIASAEVAATAEVKAAAAELAANAAGRLLAARLPGMSSDPLVDQAIGQIGTRLQ